MTITSKIRKQGNAAVISIPPAVLEVMKLDVGGLVELSVEHGKLIAQPTSQVRKRYSMAELLKGGADIKKLNADVAWAQEGDPIGHEIA